MRRLRHYIGQSDIQAFTRLSAVFTAHVEKHLERNFAFPLKKVDVSGLKVSAAVQINKLTAKLMGVGVERYQGFVDINFHHVFHGVTPFASNHLLTARFGYDAQKGVS